MAMNTIYSVATTRSGVGEQERLDAYLYSHSAITEVIEGPRFTAFVYRTDAMQLPRCEYLANYQAERLRSGLFGAYVVGSHGEAVERAIELVDANVVRQA